MDAIEQLQQDVGDGRIGLERLFDLLRTQQRLVLSLQQQVGSLQQQLQAAQERVAELEKKIGASTAQVAESYSVQAEEKRQQARGQQKKPKARNNRRGRRKSADKIKQAERTENCFPEGVAHEPCQLSHTRPVWRLENGRAVLVAYAIYRGPNNQYGQIPGVLGRSEFGMEIVVEIAHLVYVTKLSFDRACRVLEFLQHLKVSKAQADQLLKQLARHWRHEFEVLCTLLANSLVVHADETSWSLNSVWAFLSEKARVVLFGVPKDAETLEKILDPKTFTGLVVSDDAAVYANFTQAQKCWAHLLRKAIKLTLLAPTEQAYRAFTDRLLAIYRQACRWQRDRRLSAAGRDQKVLLLEDDVHELCGLLWQVEPPPGETELEKDYRLLVNEVLRLSYEDQLFSFVTAAPAMQPNGTCVPVSGTNNEAERTLRDSAEARKTGRTNKTLVGARRQTILVSVLESLRVYLPHFTLASVLAEIERWWQTGQSCFSRLLKKLQLTVGSASILDKVLPVPDG